MLLFLLGTCITCVLGAKPMLFNQYSVVYTIESLSLFHIHFISRCVFTRDDTSISLGSFMWDKHLFNLIHIGWNLRRQTCLSPRVFFTDHSKLVLVLWIFAVICVSCLSRYPVSSLQPCGQLLGTCWPLGSLVCDIFVVFCHFLI